MKGLHELVNTQEPAFPLVLDWISQAVRPVEVLPPSSERNEILLKVQVTTRSPLGAVAYETGGLLIGHGWLRILGSGHPRLARTLPGWNENRADGFYLIADDVMGGFFAINGGTLGTDQGNLYYFAPDRLEWEPLEIGYSTFLEWALSHKYDQFCQDLRWPGWEKEVATVPGDRCLFTYPPLWTTEGRGPKVHRGEVPVEELWFLQLDTRRQLGEP